MISGCGRSAAAVIPALGSGRYSPGPNIVLPSWRKGSDPHCTLNVFWGQPGALATVSQNLFFTAVALQSRLVVVRPPRTNVVALTAGTLEWAIFPPQRMDIGLTRFGVEELVEMRHNRHG